MLVVSCAAAALAVIGGIAFAASGDDASAERPTRGQLYRLQDRIDRQSDALARQGIYVMSTGQPAELCVAVDLANPTRPNIEFLHRQFGPNLCISRVPSGLAQSCTGRVQVRLRSGSVRVPDLSDLGIYEAARRVLASDLTYAEGCLGGRTRA